MVGTSMTKLKLEGLSTKGKTQELLAKTNPKDGILPYQVLDGSDSIGDRFGVSRAVREKDSVRAYIIDLLSS
jgi:hypothetical protein